MGLGGVPPGEPCYAPQAWAWALSGLATETGACAVLAAGTDRGNEVLAHLGAITGLPMAANCALVTPTAGARTGWSGTGGPDCCSRRRS